MDTNIQPTCPNCQQPAAGPKTVAVDGRATPVFTCHNGCKTDCAWDPNCNGALEFFLSGTAKMTVSCGPSEHA